MASIKKCDHQRAIIRERVGKQNSSTSLWPLAAFVVKRYILLFGTGGGSVRPYGRPATCNYGNHKLQRQHKIHRSLTALNPPSSFKWKGSISQLHEPLTSSTETRGEGYRVQAWRPCSAWEPDVMCYVSDGTLHATGCFIMYKYMCDNRFNTNQNRWVETAKITGLIGCYKLPSLLK